ncbi:hypothetical protein N7462_004196 [Penicillium macrosclerotiorum]|uniref:uncharacterized protein n=1 Tax=Penicillium macrosclerotiorum TaxID=303699 RepID=UPI0025483BBD|nr:uncharacterized protein N7462_004196 [Penicillium macrosclerotiorum]KAJ5689804.1 hypothetical protein N7462_004196 [Penicillium macrosclerotiorum]
MLSFSQSLTDSLPASWRKRKRDHEDSTALTRPSALIPFRIERSDCDSNCSLPLARHPSEAGDLSFRPRCLPRKRRHVVQPPYLTLPTHQQSFLSPNAYASPQDPYSPPVSPKTVLPLSYPSTSPSALRPCHICHRRPTTRQVLDAYADCDLCGERACFICLRQCDAIECPGSFPASRGEPHLLSPSEDFDGSSARRRNICSGCAVEGITETGAEIVRCLDCVQGHPTPWSNSSTPSGWTLDAMNHDIMGG